MSDYRLIWFQHFHKAAGSSVGALARQNGEIFYRRHHNGNPYDDKGRILPLWDFSEDQISAFVDECERIGTTFVASEWGAPDFRVLARDPRVVSISLLRDPWSRLVSNYTFDLIRRHAPLTPIDTYYFHHSFKFRQPNYYCRTLMAGGGVTRAQTVDELMDRAWENLAALDFVLALEAPKPIDALCAYLGWTQQVERVNSKPSFLTGLLNQVRHGDVSYAYRRWRIENRQWTRIDTFREEFEANNDADIALYRRLLQEKTGMTRS